jgi:UDPglucose--hexose-1-phosphate uridylyltransferase
LVPLPQVSPRAVAEGAANWEQRWHPLREEWIIVAAHRQDRPWIGNTVSLSDPAVYASPFDANCYLCPGNNRVGGKANPDYTATFVFDNDHPCVGIEAPLQIEEPPAPYRSKPATGRARVVCYSPQHNLTLAQLPVSAIDNLIGTWQVQFDQLSALPEVAHVLIFENKGEAVGVSNPHPHCQMYATNFVFKFIETEVRVAREYLRDTGSILFSDIIDAEISSRRRVLFENETAIVFVPWFARYAYEAIVAPKASYPNVSALSDAERHDLAEAIRQLVVRYDNLWRMPFPYVMAMHQAPVDGTPVDGFHFHLEFHPPLRKPDLLKHLAGPEIGGGNFLSDTLPESKAAELQRVSGVQHYLDED